MDPTLIKVLVVFLFYSMICLIPLWWSFKSTSKLELMANGVYLIFLASFVLTGLALVTGVAENLAGKQTLSATQSGDLAEFMQFIIFGGTVITLLFGSVGANVFTAGLLKSGNQEILRRLDVIDRKLDQLNDRATSSERLPIKFWVWRGLAVFGAILILIWAWP